MIAGIARDWASRSLATTFDQLIKLAEQVADELRQIDGADDVGPDQFAGTAGGADRSRSGRHLALRHSAPRRAEHDPGAGHAARGRSARGACAVFRSWCGWPTRYREDPDAIGQILVPTPAGARLPLARLTHIEQVETPSVIFREWAERRMLVQCNVRGRDIGSFVAEARRRVGRCVARAGRPAITSAWGGQFEHMQRAQRRLMFVVPLAGLLIFILLYATFNSVRDALLIYSGVPFAVVGGVIALYLRGMPFSISAGVGFVALFGIAVLNGLVLVSYIHKLTDEGRPLDEAVSRPACCGCGRC